ncbi:germin-like protein subfamily 3 member 2 [Cucumis sativus]|uniref:Germin-like protein n=1 Tax=Cucumis sativus TaxID=3659 RepID=A0A0A0KHH1_CUCSA|nr:germin-like protein subfamily 3 member 2 [Cucumis sativus]
MFLKIPISILLILTIAIASDPDPLQDFCIPNPKSFPDQLCKNSTAVTADDFVFSGAKSAGPFSGTGFATVAANSINFPGLNTLGMSLVRVDLKEGAINPPHVHPRAAEMVYVVEGKVYAGFVDSGNRVYAKVIEEGEVMVIPRGVVHFQMNVGKRRATVFGCFNSQNPGTQKMAAAIFGSGIKEELLEKAFGLSSKEIRRMKRMFDS